MGWPWRGTPGQRERYWNYQGLGQAVWGWSQAGPRTQTCRPVTLTESVTKLEGYSAPSESPPLSPW